MNYLEILESYHEDMKKTLKEIIAIPSVQAQPIRTAEGELLPFGRPVQDALDYMLKRGEDFGFAVYNADNYGGHIEWKAGEDNGKPRIFDIVGHLDVVPAGTGWKNDPFALIEKDRELYGRGVSDDKGPMVACMYAMKALKEAGLEPKKSIRLVFGLDEEQGIDGINYYLKQTDQPDEGFTPDGYFPLVNGEKGILIFELAMKLTRQTTREGMRLTRLEAGTAGNAVPSACKAVIAGDALIYEHINSRLAQYAAKTEYKIKSRKQGSSLVIESFGKAAHAAHPEEGLNAVSIMMDFLGGLQFSNDEVNEYIDFYNSHIGFDLNGERLGCGFEDEQSGKLTQNVGLATINEELATVTVNIRYPVTVTEDGVYEGIEAALAGSRIGIVKIDNINPFFVGVDTPMVEKMMEAYIEETGSINAKPFVIGGGTYAKAVKNTLAFGALFPGEEDTMHQVDERLSLESWWKMSRIYARALYKLCFE